MMCRVPSCLAAAALLAALPASAQDSTPEERAILRETIAQVNEGGRDAPAPLPGGDGFFGNGFYMAFEPIANGADGDRVGSRPETSTTYRPGRSDAFLRR